MLRGCKKHPHCSTNVSCLRIEGSYHRRSCPGSSLACSEPCLPHGRQKFPGYLTGSKARDAGMEAHQGTKAFD
eukprot:scaffold9382_cov18-Tisochrysis_lutea.AAC.3